MVRSLLLSNLTLTQHSLQSQTSLHMRLLQATCMHGPCMHSIRLKAHRHSLELLLVCPVVYHDVYTCTHATPQLR